MTGRQMSNATVPTWQSCHLALSVFPSNQQPARMHNICRPSKDHTRVLRPLPGGPPPGGPGWLCGRWLPGELSAGWPSDSLSARWAAIGHQIGCAPGVPYGLSSRRCPVGSPLGGLAGWQAGCLARNTHLQNICPS